MNRGIGAVLLGLIVTACGGRTDRLSGLAGPADPPPCDANPDGACYPTTDVGTAVGDRIADYRFLGFRSTGANAVDDTSETQTIALSDYYDPTGERGIKLLVVMVNTRWCPPSNAEADFVAGANHTGENLEGASYARELEPLGVRFLEVLVDGLTVGTAATLSDLRAWVADHQIDYTAVLSGGDADDSYGQLGAFFPMIAIPFNMMIDARSMEVLETTVGFDTEFEQKLQTWLAWEKTHTAK